MKQEKDLALLAKALDEMLPEIYETDKMGFALVVFEFHKPGIGDYVSNADRPDMIKALRELADRLEKNEIIPAAIGQA